MRGSILVAAASVLFFTSVCFGFNPFVPEKAKKKKKVKKEARQALSTEKGPEYEKLKREQFVFVGMAKGAYIFRDKKTGALILLKEGDSLSNCKLVKGELLCRKR